MRFFLLGFGGEAQIIENSNGFFDAMLAAVDGDGFVGEGYGVAEAFGIEGFFDAVDAYFTMHVFWLSVLV